jgi:hypothetical protein
MSVAKILYYRFLDPRENKAAGVKIVDDIYFSIRHDRSMDGSSVAIPIGLFRAHWKTLPVKEPIDDSKPVMAELERLFMKYNFDETNPINYRYPEMQAWIRQNRLHTSMSIGDVVQVKGVNYIAAGAGFKRVELR